MPLMKEKKFSLAGFHVGIATDASRAARLRNSQLYKYLVRPGMDLLGWRNDHATNGNGHSAASEMPAAPIDPASLDSEGRSLWERVKKIGWYHTIELGHGVVTPGFIDNRPTVHLFGLPEDLTGKRCLDIGTYDGFWGFEFERRGASEVVGIDVDSPLEHDMPRPARLRALAEVGTDGDVHRTRWDDQAGKYGLQYPGAGFRLAKEVLGSKMEREAVNVYDVSPERLGMFDLVFISQLLLRLRDPQTVIENMISVLNPGGIAIIAEPYEPEIESLGRPLSEYLGTNTLGVW
ncbi:MAG: class I SAM-dependent methyltransferase, partial [Dehalococcoidia bacterium]